MMLGPKDEENNTSEGKPEMLKIDKDAKKDKKDKKEKKEKKEKKHKKKSAEKEEENTDSDKEWNSDEILQIIASI